MAISFQAPNAGSTITTAGSVPSSSAVPVWVGFATTYGASGCVVWYKGASPVAGSELVPIAVAGGEQIILGPFYIPGGVSTCSISGGSALVYFMQ